MGTETSTRQETYIRRNGGSFRRSGLGFRGRQFCQHAASVDVVVASEQALDDGPINSVGLWST